jgi:excisionase family DNA binding protein
MAHLEIRKTFYTPTEVAQLIGKSRQSVVKRLEKNEIPGATRTSGGHWRIPVDAVKDPLLPPAGFVATVLVEA